MTGGPLLSAVLIVQNEERRLEPCLQSLQGLCDEIVVIDGGSKDETLAIARRYTDRVAERPYREVNEQKELGRSLARGSWILNVDADERVTPLLREEIRAAVASKTFDAYEIPIQTFFRDVWVWSCGFWPARRLRLFLREKGRWSAEEAARRRVQECVAFDGPARVGRLRAPLEHRSFESLAQWVAKAQQYSSISARLAFGAGRRAGFGSLLWRPAFRFLKAYLLRRGFAQGEVGLMVSGMQAYETFARYAKLWELSRWGDAGPGAAGS